MKQTSDDTWKKKKNNVCPIHIMLMFFVPGASHFLRMNVKASCLQDFPKQESLQDGFFFSF